MTHLLAPAGGPESLVAAVQNGADEIYLGLREFSARAGAENFSLEDLEARIGYAHVRGVRINVAVNILLSDAELPRAEALVAEADRLGADAFIIQDTGLARRLAGKVSAALHASTQMTVMNIHGLREARAMGFSRAVLARELSIEEIGELCAAGIMETEVFCHGALCMNYSGQCLLGYAVSGRSGNRGTCSQPCRLRYRRRDDGFSYLMSPADLCALPYLDRLAATGVSALKIEGRLKSPDYVAAVTSAYRRGLDSIAAGTFDGFDSAAEVKKLATVFSRGGFCSGHQLGKLQLSDVTSGYPGKTGLLCGSSVGRCSSFEKNGVRLFKFTASVTEKLSCGDGISFKDSPDRGGVVNVIEADGRRADSLLPGRAGVITVCGEAPSGADVPFYKTYDKALSEELSATYKPGAELRKIPVAASLYRSGGTVFLALSDGKNTAEAAAEALSRAPGEAAAAPDSGFAEKAENVIRATGGTPFAVTVAAFPPEDPEALSGVTFSMLKHLRREAVEKLAKLRERRQ
ncbi:MAG: DUF3656 domain-containing protein [Clostridia bacterium]|nr:DUF3656 domain-containing protein [Clostridia bacterium]